MIMLIILLIALIIIAIVTLIVYKKVIKKPSTNTVTTQETTTNNNQTNNKKVNNQTSTKDNKVVKAKKKNVHENINKTPFANKMGIARFLSYVPIDGKEDDFLSAIVYDDGKFGIMFEIEAAFYQIAEDLEKEKQSMIFADAFKKLTKSENVVIFITTEAVDYTDMINESYHDLDKFNDEYIGVGHQDLNEIANIITQENVNMLRDTRYKKRKKQEKYYITYVASPQYVLQRNYDFTKDDEIESYYLDAMADVMKKAYTFLSGYQAGQINVRRLNIQETVNVIGNSLNQTINDDYIDIIKTDRAKMLNLAKENSLEDFIEDIRTNVDLSYNYLEAEVEHNIQRVKKEMSLPNVSREVSIELQNTLKALEDILKEAQYMRLKNTNKYLTNQEINNRLFDLDNKKTEGGAA